MSRKLSVFIVYSSSDLDYAKRIDEELTARGVHCIADFKGNGEFVAGQPVLHNISECVENSGTTLLVLTRESINSSWLKLETILALEKSQRIGCLCLRAVVFNVTDEEVAKLLCAMDSEHMQTINIDFNVPTWQDHLMESIASEIPYKNSLSVGCIAHGQVFSHFIGYLRYILPELSDKIISCDIYKNNSGKMPTCYFILLPSNGNVPTSLDTSGNSANGITVQKVSMLTWKSLYAGKERQNTPAIYKLVKNGENGKEEIFCVGEFPTIMGTMFELNDRKLAKVDVKLQVARFYFMLDYILNHHHMIDVHNTVRLLPFNVSREHYTEVLWEAVTQELQTSEEAPSQRRLVDRLLSQDPSPGTYDVTVSACDEYQDLKVKEEIVTRLMEEGKRVLSDGGTTMEHLKDARWNIFIISKSSLGSPDHLYRCYSALTRALDQNQLRVIPVLVGDLEPTELPRVIKWVTVIPQSHNNYLDLLLHAISGKYVTMEGALPQGDVATGLAWAYLINYLPITLLNKSKRGLDFRQRVEEFMKIARADEKVPLECKCLCRMIVIAPKSCDTGKSIPEVAEAVHLGNLDPVEKMMGGSSRIYKLHVYYFKKMNICFICEYATPAATMHEMVNWYKYAGLTEEAMNIQIRDFVDQVNNTIHAKPYKDKVGDLSNVCKVLYIDDDRGFGTCLEAELQKEVIDEDMV